MRSRMRSFAAVLALALLAACPKPMSMSTSHEPLPGNGAKEAQGRFESARARFAQDARNADEFQAIVRDYPDDPIAPYAALYAGMAAHKQGDDTAAAAALGQVEGDAKTPDEVKQRARFWLGVADAAIGKSADAQRLLVPFDGKVEGDEQIELDAALAEALAGQGDTAGALHRYEAFFRRARPAERAYVATRVAALVDGLPNDQVAGLYDASDKGGAVCAYLGRRYAAILRAQGQGDRAERVLGETARARAAVGLPDEESVAAGNADPSLIGAVLPLSGKRRLVGEAAARGVGLAAGTFDRGTGGGVVAEGVPRPFEVAVEDAGDGKGRAAAAVDQLAVAGVIGIVGPVDKDAVDEAARRAETLGLPLVSLDVAEAGGAGSPYLFRAVVPVESRARALAEWALAHGAHRFAILAPDIPYGARARAAFEKAVVAGGCQVVANESYKKDVTTFVEPVGRIAKQGFDALFVPDSAARLELIAPQLAVADLTVQPIGGKKTAAKNKHGRAILLLSTAEAVSPKFLKGSGRYTLGAALAPGFYPDDADPRIGPYVQRFRLAYGDDPTWLDAYAYDAAILIRSAVEAGARDRAGVAAALAAVGTGSPVPGVTGDVAFDPSHGRADHGFLYTVVADGAGQAIHVLKK